MQIARRLVLRQKKHICHYVQKYLVRTWLDRAHEILFSQDVLTTLGFP
jgi:hypothetical protein